MRFPSIPKFKLNSAEEKEEPSPPPPLFLRVFPLSLSLPLPTPSSSWTATVTKPYRSSSTDTLVMVSQKFSVIVTFATVILTIRIFRWAWHWQENNEDEVSVDNATEDGVQVNANEGDVNLKGEYLIREQMKIKNQVGVMFCICGLNCVLCGVGTVMSLMAKWEAESSSKAGKKASIWGFVG